jgi:hypothetical protein
MISCFLLGTGKVGLALQRLVCNDHRQKRISFQMLKQFLNFIRYHYIFHFTGVYIIVYGKGFHHDISMHAYNVLYHIHTLSYSFLSSVPASFLTLSTSQ